MTKAVHCLTVQPTDHLLSATLFSNSVTTAQPKILNPTVNSVIVNVWIVFYDLRLVSGESVTAVKRWNFHNAAELQPEQTATAATSKKTAKMSK